MEAILKAPKESRKKLVIDIVTRMREILNIANVSALDLSYEVLCVGNEVAGVTERLHGQ